MRQSSRINALWNTLRGIQFVQRVGVSVIEGNLLFKRVNLLLMINEHNCFKCMTSMTLLSFVK